jgi:hypothetical protein
LGVFDNPEGAFNPNQPITRAEFVRWLVKANNAIFAAIPEKQIRVAESDEATFPDVPATHPDFQYIQGMANSGIAVGYDEKTFKPDQLLTREEMISIKDGLDHGAVKRTFINKGLISQFSDYEQISSRFVGSIVRDSIPSDSNIGRTFGPIKAFQPKSPVTRAEAATCISVIGSVGNSDKPKSSGGTAEQALKVISGQSR